MNDMITNAIIATVSAVGGTGIVWFANLIASDTPITLQTAVVFAGAVWGAAWWISALQRKIDSRLTNFDERLEGLDSRQVRQWNVMLLLLRKSLPAEEAALIKELEAEKGEKTTNGDK